MPERLSDRARRRAHDALHGLRARARALPRAPALLERNPLELQLLGRMLLHAAIVGVAAGFMGALFFAALEYAQSALLGLAGYVPLRAHGERFAESSVDAPFRWWVLALLPAAGGVLCGLVLRFAPEAKGGGGDATIEAFHHKGGVIRPRVVWVKGLASIFTLGTGGAGGREGPTMQVGGALGSLVGGLLRVGPRERRILLVAGVAAGISAVFRTPLGAALLAVEILYKDGFETDALIPAVFASVVSYSIVISLFGESTLFLIRERFPFVPAHLPLYVALAIVVSAGAVLFTQALRRVRALSRKLPGPAWARPAWGGLALGALATPLILVMSARIGAPGQGLGVLGGGYGAVQMAISGSKLLPAGWGAVEVLAVLAVAKIAAASLTIGTGGSAGDFAPSLAIGGLIGGAFGRAAALLFDDPRIAPGAFALVGMGAFYGGIAHVPLASLVLVCEMAGSYDLLVPLMLALGVSFVLLRGPTLYPAQVKTLHDSPVHRDAFSLRVLKAIPVRDVVSDETPHAAFAKKETGEEMLRLAAAHGRQDVFPVVDDAGRVVGMVTGDALRVLLAEPDAVRITVAADLMQPAAVVRLNDDLHDATRVLLGHRVREIPVVDDEGRLIAFLDESRIAHLVFTRGEAAAAET